MGDKLPVVRWCEYDVSQNVLCAFHDEKNELNQENCSASVDKKCQPLEVQRWGMVRGHVIEHNELTTG